MAPEIKAYDPETPFRAVKHEGSVPWEGVPAVLVRGFPYERREGSVNELIRPRAEYIGPEYPQRYVPVESR